MTGFTVEPDPLYGTGAQYEFVRSQLAAIYYAAHDGLAAAGNFAGNDAAGKACKATCERIASEVLDRIDTTHQGINSIADTIANWATSYPGIDQALEANTPPTG